MSREQKIINAQVEVNRAVFLMNARGTILARTHEDLDTSDGAICKHIASAIRELTAARKGYLTMTSNNR